MTYGKLYARILQKISTMDLLYARTLVKKKPLPWIGWLDGKLCARTISTMDGKLYARTLQKISTMDLLYASHASSARGAPRNAIRGYQPYGKS